MLPQPNNVARASDLTELAIYINGEADGVFHSGDYILFYAEGPDHFHMDRNSGVFQYERNLYDNANYYFITVSTTNGKRIQTQANAAGTFPVVSEFENFEYHELDQHSELKSGREWFGERFDLETTKSFTVDAPGIVTGSEIKLVSNVMARSFLGSSFAVRINNTQVGSHDVIAVPNTPYGVKGRHAVDTFRVEAGTVGAPTRTSQVIQYEYSKAPSGTSYGFLDYFLLQYTQSLTLRGKQTQFRSLKSLDNAVTTFQIEGVDSKSILWDVTDPYTPLIQENTINGGEMSFSASTSELKDFVVFNTDVSLPKAIGEVNNQNLHSMASPEILIVTPKEFENEALRLASHRTTVSNLDVSVVRLPDIYNEFSSGRRDITAIRDFVKFLYDKDAGKLKTLLLFGKTSYDYKNLTIDNRNFIPTYESRNSLHPLQSYASDDYYGFLEDTEGDWGEEPAANHSMDIGVGRLPVKTIAEAKGIIDKIIDYETQKTNKGEWQKLITFVADDGNTADGFTSIHQSQADFMAEMIESTDPSFDTEKIFLGVYEKSVTPGGERSPKAADAIREAFESGSLVINYTGHGAEKLWADERIFDELSINDLENKRYPFLVTATCEFGRQDDPILISSGESVVLKENAGAIGIVTTTRLVNSSTNFALNQAFYNAFLQKQNNSYQTVGEIFRLTKNNSLSGVANRNFSLLADPSMKLNMPTRKIVVNEILTEGGSSTVKALSKVIVKGEVQDFDDVIDTNFDGTLTATMFDKQTSFTTIGKNNPPFNFAEWDNALFRGRAAVVNGQFEFEFIVTKNIAYQIAEGKLSLYAFDDTRNIDAAGYSKNFTIGSSEPATSIDQTPPLINLYIGDTTFVNGGVTDPDTYMVATFYDASGMNISGYGIGNSITATLDNGTSFNLNDYYYSSSGNFTRGMIRYPLHDLTPGRHTLTLKAWDTYNNPAQATVDFVVTDGNQLVINDFSNYPNPFNSSTTLYFTHNRSGDELMAKMSLLDRTGAEILNQEIHVLNSNYHVEMMKLDRSNGVLKNLPGGLYFARLVVRSLSNGSKNERVTKVILLN